MKIAIFSRFLKQEHEKIVAELFAEFAKKKQIKLCIFKEYLESFNGRIDIVNEYETYNSYQDFKVLAPDFCITLGGDGTILEAVTIIRDSAVPILGINLGRLGFLAMFEKKQSIGGSGCI